MKRPSPASVAGIERITASTPSSGARSTSGGRPGVSGNHSRATGSPALHLRGRLEQALEDPVLRRDHVVGGIASVEDHGVGLAEGGARLHLALEHAHVPEHVREAAPGELVDGGGHAAAAAELGRDHELALVLGLDAAAGPVPFTSM